MFRTDGLTAPGRLLSGLFRRGILALAALLAAPMAFASEADLKLPALGSVSFMGMPGHELLTWGLVVCVGGMLFGLMMFMNLKNMPVHKSMREISE